MKSIAFFITLMAFMPFKLQSQVTDTSLINPRMVKERINFNVTNNARELSSESATIGTFHLSPAQRRAVTITGRDVTKLDREHFPILPDTATRTGINLLPELYYARERGTGDEISFRIIYVDSSPLRFDFESKIYAGMIRFLAVESDYVKDTRPVQKFLESPEQIWVSFSSEPIPCTISSINWPPQDVTIQSPNAIDSMKVTILTVSNPAGYPKFLPVEPAISLSSVRTVIQGLGVQTLPVSVALKGITTHKPVRFTVQSSLGSIDSANLILSDDEPRTINVRSEGVGDMQIEVVNTNYRSNSILVKEVFPWIFLLSAIIGGLIGSIGKKLNDKESITFSSLMLGCFFGLIVAVAYWGLGIKLLNITFDTRILNEIMVFGLGLLAGYLGIVVSG